MASSAVSASSTSRTTAGGGGSDPRLPDSEIVTASGPGTWRTAMLLMGVKGRLTVATFTKSPAVIVGVVLGGLSGLLMILLLGGAMYGAGGFLAEEAVRATAVLVGAGFTAAWWLFAIVSGRADATLHASQFALFPLRRRGIALGQLLGGLVGIAGPVTLLGLLFHASVWRLDGTAVATAVVLIPFGWLLMVLGNRCLTAMAERLAGQRRIGEILTLLLLGLMMLTGPILTGLLSGVQSLGDRLYSVADVVAWTPLGALWAIPAEISNGNALVAAARAAVVVATFMVLLWLWGSALEKSTEQATGSVRSGGARHGATGAGLFDRLPAKPWAAVAARSLIYWVKDPRYSGSLVVVPFMLVLFWFTSAGGGGGMLLFAGPFVGFLMAYTISGDVAYDHKGFGLHILAGVSGWADRLGRVVGMLLPGVILTALSVVLSLVFSGRWELLAALIGTSTLALLGGAGISSVISARYTYPVPLPGQSPFKTPQGFTFLNILAQGAAMLVMGIMTLPAIIPFSVQLFTGSMAAGVVSLVIGVVLGPALCAGGIWLGGKWLEARAPELLGTVSNYR